jgi:GT2 family glycosyltransferase
MAAGRAQGDTPETSVVICAYTLDRWDDLVAAVDSAAAQVAGQSAPGEVIVVTDHNEALQVRATDRWPGVSVRPSGGPPGLSGARNTGVAAATGAIVAFLDDDARAEPGWLAALLEPFQEPDVVATGGYAEAAWDAGRPRWFPPEFDWVVGCAYVGLPTGRAEVRNPIGSSMAFRTEAVRAAGGFRVDIGRFGTTPTGGEETELCIRLRQADPDRRVVFNPAARVRHRVRANRATWSYFRARCYQEGRSKAAISAAVGSEAALASERRYTARVLPTAVLRGVRDAIHGDLYGMARAFVVATGLAITAVGYLAGRAGLAVTHA